MEKKRYYRATAKARGEDLYAMTFRADSIQLAFDHAIHCFDCDGRGMEVVTVEFLGVFEPAAMGEIIPLT